MTYGHIQWKTIKMKESELYKQDTMYTEHTNNTTKFLTPMIFTTGANALRMLSNFGLVNVYVDDYGYKSKYQSCLFFLFNPPESASFEVFQDKITSFDSFYDFYDIDTLRMFVFRPNVTYIKDIDLFKQGRFKEMSVDYRALLHRNTSFDGVVIDIPKEIYRFELSLS